MHPFRMNPEAHNHKIWLQDTTDISLSYVKYVSIFSPSRRGSPVSGSVRDRATVAAGRGGSKGSILYAAPVSQQRRNGAGNTTN